MNQTARKPLVEYLEKLAADGNRAALASLRRGLGKPPGTVVEMMPFVVPFISASETYAASMRASFLVSALFASHPHSAQSGNMGDHFAALLRAKGKDAEDSIERRFRALLACHEDSLTYQLRQAVSLLRSADISINWDSLLSDIPRWDHPERYIQRRWARSFWSFRAADNTEIETDQNEE